MDLRQFYDREFNPDGSSPVIPFVMATRRMDLKRNGVTITMESLLISSWPLTVKMVAEMKEPIIINTSEPLLMSAVMA